MSLRWRPDGPEGVTVAPLAGSIVIRRVRAEEVQEARDFALAAREHLFPKLQGTATPADLAGFEALYVQGAGCFVLARDQGRLIGAVGSLPYDGRFPGIDYPGLAAVEVVRLFVLPAYRRVGVAQALYGALEAQAREAGVEVMYLHTHPFLAGAEAFWRRQGFEQIRVDRDPPWHTTHMQRRLHAVLEQGGDSAAEC